MGWGQDDMAYIDYRWCNACGEKAFYDADLQYGSEKYAQNGQLLPDGRVADMACLCEGCIKTHKIVIEQISDSVGEV